MTIVSMGCETSHTVVQCSKENASPCKKSRSRKSVNRNYLDKTGGGSMDSSSYDGKDKDYDGGGCLQILNEMQIDCIRSTWPVVAKNRTKHGSNIFLDIFSLEPDVKTFFKFRDLSDSELVTEPAFLRHVTRYMNTLDLVCDNLEQIHDPESAAHRHLLILGATHAHIASLDFRYFHVFPKCTHITWEQVLGEEYTSDVREAWTIVFDFIVHKIQEGFLIYMNEQEKQLKGTADSITQEEHLTNESKQI